jgi:hypothetical protein
LIVKKQPSPRFQLLKHHNRFPSRCKGSFEFLASSTDFFFFFLRQPILFAIPSFRSRSEFDIDDMKSPSFKFQQLPSGLDQPAPISVRRRSVDPQTLSEAMEMLSPYMPVKSLEPPEARRQRSSSDVSVGGGNGVGTGGGGVWSDKLSNLR